VRLGIDLDGVVADFNAGWITRYNRDFDGAVGLGDVTDWDGIPNATHFPDMAAFWAWARTLDGASLFRHLDPYPGSVDALERLAHAGHQIVVLTHKPHWAIHDTFWWIAEHRLPTTEVHITDDKHLVRCDVYLDDAPYQVRAIHVSRPAATVCRFVRPWNRPVPGVADVADWAEFEALVTALARNAPRLG